MPNHFNQEFLTNEQIFSAKNAVKKMISDRYPIYPSEVTIGKITIGGVDFTNNFIFDDDVKIDKSIEWNK